MTTIETLRATYRALRDASGMDPVAFDQAAGRLTHELSDGEDILPSHWVQAAREVLQRHG